MAQAAIAFVAKLNDAEAEASETQTWIEFSRRCGYLTTEQSAQLDEAYEAILGQLVVMVNQPEKWVVPGYGSSKVSETGPEQEYMTDSTDED
jgi:hypothetical protein